MSRTEIRNLVDEKLKRQELPTPVSMLKFVDCEIGNLLDCNVLDGEWKDIFEALHKRVNQVIDAN